MSDKTASDDVTDDMFYAAQDAVLRAGGWIPSHNDLRLAISAALRAAPTADGWLWCESVQMADTHVDPSFHRCPGPHYKLALVPIDNGSENRY